MPIGKDNLKLMKSQRMTDNEDGGGRITGAQIQDNESNEIFDDITDLDRVTGNVSLRKVYPWVDTTDQDGYFGANVVLADQPDDPSVSVTMMQTDNFDDTRTAAREKIERYLVKANRSDYGLIGNHFAGQRVLTWFAVTQRTPPEVGETYVIENENGLQQEYVRIVDIDASIQTFLKFDSNGQLIEFDGWNIIAEISAPLEYDYIGGQADEIGSQDQDEEDERQAYIYKTQVADAARYYGVKAMTEDAVIGDTSLRVESLFTQLVPSAQGETAITDARGAQTKDVNRPISLNSFTSGGFINWISTIENGPNVIYLPGALVPGTLFLNIKRGGSVVVTLADTAGDGTLEITSGGTITNPTVDYDTGIVRFDSTSSGGGQHQIQYNYKPGGRFAGNIISDEIFISQVNRGFNYSGTYNIVKPVANTLTIAYMVLGEWYTLEDNGEGQILGAGSGNINYQTGTVAFTLQELPDVDSYIVIQFIPNGPDEIIDLSGTVENPLRYAVNLGDSVNQGSLEIRYTSSGVEYLSTDTTSGTITGEGSGAISFRTGRINFAPDRVPDPDTDITVDFETNEYVTLNIAENVADKNVYETYLQLTGVGITQFFVQYTATWQFAMYLGGRIIDTDVAIQALADGVLKFRVNDTGTWRTLEDSFVNYTTGELRIRWPRVQLQNYLKNGDPISHTPKLRPDTDVTGFYRYVDANTAQGTTATLQTSQAVINLPLVNERPFIAGSLQFEWLEQKYYDDKLGNLFIDFSPVDGSSTNAGTINYETGLVSIDQFNQVAGLQTDLVINTGAAFGPAVMLQDLTFRTAGAPIRSLSFQAQAYDVDGEPYSFQANGEGIVEGTGLYPGPYDENDIQLFESKINYETGLVKLNFYPLQIVPESVLYNAVQQVFIPLDADIIGLNPVRLPMDGRVPIYRTGEVIVAHNEQTVEIATPVADQEIDVGRARLSEVRVYDANDNLIPSTQYIEDLDAGIITLASVIDTSTYVAPWNLIHRVEDMALVNDVDINGTINLTRAVSHNYTAGESYVSTAMLVGDLQSRVTNVFDQETWTNEWSDQLIGDEPSAEYDNTTYPLEVDNRGTLYQRWALVFTGQTSFNIVGETVGNIGVGQTSADIAPTNPNTGTPYFTIRSAGWGSGWSAGNVLRFKTVSSNYPVWVARTVTQSNPTDEPDQFRIQVRGNINT